MKPQQTRKIQPTIATSIDGTTFIAPEDLEFNLGGVKNHQYYGVIGGDDFESPKKPKKTFKAPKCSLACFIVLLFVGGLLGVIVGISIYGHSDSKELNCGSGVKTPDFESCNYCPLNHYGPKCTPCASTCNNRGICSDGSMGNGTCICKYPFSGEFCMECVSGRSGRVCEIDDKDGALQMVNGIRGFNTCGRQSVVSITFDDGPSIQKSEMILYDLDLLGLKATFFIAPITHNNPGDISTSPGQCLSLRKMIQKGHTIGAHGWSHKPLDQITIEQLQSELDTAYRWIYQCVGDDILNVKFDLYRPPFGIVPREHAIYLNSIGYSIVTWSVDSADYKGAGTQLILDTIEKQFHAGQSALILLHETSYESGLLSKITDFYQQQNYNDYTTTSGCHILCSAHSECSSIDATPFAALN